MKVSVIVPVYNVEKYLDDCVKSIVNQTYTDLEILLIDDGSSDNSPKICDEWAEKDRRIRVIHKKNGGLSDARNTGLRLCLGQWVLFIDSDDYYESSETIYNLVNCAAKYNSDIVCMNYKRFYESSNSYSKALCSLRDSKNDIDSVVKNNIYTSSVCLKLMNSNILKSTNLCFETGVYSEDIEFSAQLLKMTKKISFCPNAVYIYRLRDNSITTSIGKKNISDIYNIVKRLSEDTTGYKHYWNYTSFQYCTLLINMNFAELDRETKKAIYSLDWLLKYHDINQIKLIYLVKSMLGIALTSKLLFFYFNHFNRG